MAIWNIILKDNGRKLYEPMLSLRDEIEALINKNVNTLNKSGKNLMVHDYAEKFIEELKKDGWKLEIGLHEKLINEYNNNPNNKVLLDRWIGHSNK